MKRIIAIAMTSVMVAGCATSSNNPLLEEFATPHGTPPFEQIKLEHYMPAFDEAISQSRAEIDAIVNNPEAPTFDNTIVALERQGAMLSRVATIFFALNHSATSPEMDEIANQLQPKLTALSNDVNLNPVLFERVKAVYDEYTRNGGNYTSEQKMLLEQTYKGFARSGAALGDEDKEKYRQISTELAGLTLKFGQNVLAATNAFSMNIPAQDSAKVEYMPQFVRDAMAQEAAARGEQGWTVTLQAPSYIPFMTYSRERDLKEKLYRAYNTRSYGGEFANDDNVRRITELRLQMANLLGYETYADYVLEERMAGDRPTVENFLAELLSSTRQWAQDEYRDVERFAARNGGPQKLMPWDFSYYSELYKTEKYAVNQEQLKPYFQLENVEKGTFLLAEKLFGLTFKANPEIQLYHPDAKAFEVYDRDGSFLAVLYMDYFPRESKRGGAWMTSFREMQTTEQGEEIRPFVTLNFNFTKPTGDTPALLTFDEFEVVLHEFGHGLHGMLAEGTYESLTGTSVYRDFVELPSQLLENWATEKEFLDLWAVHYQTGEKIPAELIEKINASKHYLAAYGNVGQLRYGMNDMAWHSITAPVTGDIAEFERRATAATQIAPVVEGTCFSSAFSHIFSGGYAVGYYGYKWAEVLEADAFSLFREKGIFNPEVAGSYRQNILSKGGTEHPMTLYVNFRGHKPQTAALIKKIGEGHK